MNITEEELKGKKPKLSETAFASQVEDLLSTFGWRWMHPRPGRVLRHGKEIYETPYSGHKGFPDYCAVRGIRLLFIELKDQYGKLSPEQEEWQRILSINPSIEYYLWRPNDFDEVCEVLR